MAESMFSVMAFGHPAPAVTRQLPAEHPQIQHFLHIGRAEHRHRGADKHVLGLVRQRGRFASVVIPATASTPATVL